MNTETVIELIKFLETWKECSLGGCCFIGLDNPSSRYGLEELHESMLLNPSEIPELVVACVRLLHTRVTVDAENRAVIFFERIGFRPPNHPRILNDTTIEHHVNVFKRSPITPKHKTEESSNSPAFCLPDLVHSHRGHH